MSYDYEDKCGIALMIKKRYDEAEKKEQKKLEELREARKRVFQGRVKIFG